LTKARATLKAMAHEPQVLPKLGHQTHPGLVNDLLLLLLKYIIELWALDY